MLELKVIYKSMNDLLEKIKKERQEWLSESYTREIKSFPPRYAEIKTTDIPEKVLQALVNGKGLYLWGGCGTGKTHIAYAIKKKRLENSYKSNFNYIDRRVNVEELNYSFSCDDAVTYKNFPNLLKKIKSSFDTEEKESIAETVRYAFRDINNKPIPSALLILDDVGAEKFTDWTIENLYEVINSCYEQMYQLMIISNLSLKELAENVGDRIPSRISEMCEVIKLSGKDRRVQ